MVSQKLASKHAAGVRNAQASQTIGTIPYWSSSFIYQGKTYPYSMVGTNPNKSATTIVQTIIIPIDLTLATGEKLAGSSNVNNVLNSAMYKSTKLKTGTTRYGDDIQRAEFWNSVSTKSKDYHVLLKNTHVYPAVKVAVPADKGKIVDTKVLGSVGVLDGDWFGQAFAEIYFNSIKYFSPGVVPIFLTGNVLAGGAGGFHNTSLDNNGKQMLTTYIYSGYFTGTNDLHGVSHEVAEWLNDPFVNNFVLPWAIPAEAGGGCNSILEVGDPLATTVFKIGNHYFQDEAFLPWFARAPKSTSFNGQYTYLNTLKTYAQPCVATPVPTSSSTPVATPGTPTPGTPVPTATTGITPTPGTPVPAATTGTTPTPGTPSPTVTTTATATPTP